jgi:hypothetical protein
MGWFLCIYSLTLYFACCGAIACLFKDTKGGFSQQNRQPAQNLRTKPACSNQKPNIGANSDLIRLI